MKRMESVYLSEDAYGANGEMDHEERIRRCADRLVDYVYEALLDRGISFWRDYEDGDRARVIYEAVQRLVATQLVEQFDDDERRINDIALHWRTVELGLSPVPNPDRALYTCPFTGESF